MEPFGFAIVLSFVDQASTGMAGATNRITQMSQATEHMTDTTRSSNVELYALYASLMKVGSILETVGKKILGTFASITKSVISTGNTFNTYRLSLNALLGSADATSQKLKELQVYATKTPFTMESTVNSYIRLKTVGIDAMTQLTESTSGQTQALMDYASDFAAMFRDMRNVYGTGIDAAVGAFREYIAEGNKITLKRSAGIDVEQQLGESKGATPAERMQQLADVVGKLNIVGYTKALLDTPALMISNLEDAITNFKAAVSDTGVFAGYTKLVRTVHDYVVSLVANTEKYEALIQIVSGAISEGLEAAQKLLDSVIPIVDKITDWAVENSELSKTLVRLTSVMGVLFVVAGLLFKSFGQVFLLLTITRRMNTFASALLSVSKSSSIAVARLIPLAAIGYLIYKAWSQNWFGLHDKVSSFFEKVQLISAYFKNGGFTKKQNDLAEQLGLKPLVEFLAIVKYNFSNFVAGVKKGIEALGNKLSALFKTTSKFKDSSIITALRSLVEPGNGDKWVEIGTKIGDIIGKVSLLYGAFSAFRLISKIFGKALGFGSLKRDMLHIVLDFGRFKKSIDACKKSFSEAKKDFAVFSFSAKLIAKAAVRDFRDAGKAIAETFSPITRVLGTAANFIQRKFSRAVSAIKVEFSILSLQISNFKNNLENSLLKAFSKITTKLSPIRNAFQRTFKSIASAVSGTFSKIATKLEPFKKGLESAFNKVSAVASKAGNFIKKNTISAFTKIGAFGGKVGHRIKEGFGVAAAGAHHFVKATRHVMHGLSSVGKASAHMVKSVGKVGAKIGAGIGVVSVGLIALSKMSSDRVSEISKGIINGITSMVKNLPGIIKSVVAEIPKILTALTSNMGSLKDAFSNGIKTLLDALPDIIPQLVSLITTIVSSVGTIFKDNAPAILEGIVSLISGLAGAIPQILPPLVQGIKALIPELIKAVVEIAPSLLQAAVDLFTALVEAIPVIIPALLGAVNSLIGALTESLPTLIPLLIQGAIALFLCIVEAIPQLIPVIIDAAIALVMALVKSLPTLIPALVMGAVELFLGIIQAIPTIITSLIDAGPEIIHGLIDGIEQAIGSLWEYVKSLGSRMMSSIKSALGLGGSDESSGTSTATGSTVGHHAGGTNNFIGGLTYINEKGGELVDLPRGSRIIPHDQSIRESLKDGITLGAKAMSMYANANKSSVVSAPSPSNDYSVTFEAGSVVIQLSGTSDSDLEAVADRLMKLIARKQQLRAMAERK